MVTHFSERNCKMGRRELEVLIRGIWNKPLEQAADALDRADFYTHCPGYIHFPRAFSKIDLRLQAKSLAIVMKYHEKKEGVMFEDRKEAFVDFAKMIKASAVFTRKDWRKDILAMFYRIYQFQ